jgi:hypothetical protein
MTVAATSHLESIQAAIFAWAWRSRRPGLRSGGGHGGLRSHLAVTGRPIEWPRRVAVTHRKSEEANQDPTARTRFMRREP